MIEVKNLRKSFGDLEVIKGVDLKINKGDVISIIGPSGSGKTTLLRCMNFLEKADAGVMTFDEKNIRYESDAPPGYFGYSQKDGFCFSKLQPVFQ